MSWFAGLLGIPLLTWGRVLNAARGIGLLSGVSGRVYFAGIGTDFYVCLGRIAKRAIDYRFGDVWLGPTYLQFHYIYILVKLEIGGS